MLVREQTTDAKTGEVTERMVEMPDVLTEAEGIALGVIAAKVAFNDSIKAKLAAADATIVRAITEGGSAKIAAHLLAQAALRAQLLP